MRTVNFLIFVLLATASLAAVPMQDGELTTSDTCGTCHRDIYRMWRASAHADAMEDPVFLTSFRDVESARGKKAARVCLNCHAPMVQVNGDWDLKNKITWEGVSCDVCHSLAAVDLSGLGPRMTLVPGPVKRGPIENAASNGHDVAFSPLHSEAIACAPCHEFVNEEGTPVMTTYSEWRASDAAERGSTCQTCHMGRTKANVVDPRVARVSQAEVNLHEVPGGHSLDQLHKALGVNFHSTRIGDELGIEVRIVNKGAGHAVPTGMPGRRIVLTVGVEAGEAGSFEEKRAFVKSFADAKGRIIERVGDYFGRGIRLESDTRIQADERRVESFRFPVPGTTTAYVSVKVQYEHATAEGEKEVLTFYSERRVVVPESYEEAGAAS